jgi:NADH:ubiquinone oxidoreductase subunit 2 (subunit N)
VAILNTVVALYYYFNIARAMFLETGFEHKIKKLDVLPVSVVVVTSIQGILFYFYWSGLYNVIQRLFS